LQERLERIPLRYYRRKDGTVFPADISISHFTLRGRRMQTVVMRDIDKNVRAEHQMQERIKELQAFYSLARISSDDSLGLEGKYQEIAEMLPASWQYPEIAVARVSVNGRHYDSNGFRSSLWVQSAPIMVHGEQVGMVEVGYLEERPTSEEGPFMKEERLLIDAVAERLGRISERHTAQARLKEIERRK
jgi:GAF domain-containing protein